MLFKSILIFLVLSFPLIAFATLDYSYPEAPGTSLNITSDSTLGDVVKYFASWAIIAGALIAFIALIHAGILYLTSVGKPEKQKEGKNRIINAALGLAILLGSYLIMITINPQLTVLHVEKTPINYGIVLLNKTGKDDLSSKSVEQIVKEGNGIYLPSKLANLQNYNLWDSKKKFGEFVSISKDVNDKVERVNFRNFGAIIDNLIKDTNNYLAFLPNPGKDHTEPNIKVIFYTKSDFKNEDGGAEYVPHKGKLGKYGEEVGGGGDDRGDPVELETPGKWAWVIELKYNDFESNVDYKDVINDKGKTTPSINVPEEKKDQKVPHPPLSFEVKKLRPGVYLYGENVGEEIYVARQEDFNLSDRKFSNSKKPVNDNLKKIEIKNSKNTDFIVSLHEDQFDSSEPPAGTGFLKIFFTRRDINGTPNDLNDDVGTAFNTPRINITSNDRTYGYVKGVSSVHIAQLDPVNSTCKRVSLCTKIYYGGECLVFHKGERVGLNEDVYIGHTPGASRQIPIYKPIDLPNTEQRVMKYKKDHPGGDVDCYNPSLDPQVYNANCEEKKVKFNDQINSIKIEGNCMVALFQHPITDSRFPGERSQVFFESIPRLDERQTNTCDRWNFFEAVKTQSCASSIAIYPLK